MRQAITKSKTKYAAALICITILASYFWLTPVYAYDPPSKVRVALETNYKEADTVPIGTGSIVFGYESGGTFRQGGRLSNASGFTVSAVNYYMARASYSSGMEQAAAMVASYASSGYLAVPAHLDDGSWAVYLCFSSESEARNVSGSEYIGFKNRAVALSYGGRISIIFDGANSFPQFGPADQAFLDLGGRKYRGYVEMSRYSGKKITPVNVLAIDDYLYSAVSSEMPSSWNDEALKAQAVASRSYTVTRMGVHKGEGYDLCDRSHCQNYIGAGNEAESTNNAVRETSGRFVHYNSQPANAVFFSSSGGVTESASYVWTNDEPYLRSVREINEVDAKEWVRSFTLAELTALAAQNSLGIGSVTGLTASGASESGRITELCFHGTNGTKSIYKEEIRTFFSGSPGGALESRNFTLQNGTAQTVNRDVYVSDGRSSVSTELKSLFGLSSEGTTGQLRSFSAMGNGSRTTLSTAAFQVTVGGDSIVFIGKGWGHGVGMSQHGAQGMALMGYTYKQILEYYYTGVNVD